MPTRVSHDMPCRKKPTMRLRSGPAMACTKKKLSSSRRRGWVRCSEVSSMRMAAANSSVLRARSTSWLMSPTWISTSKIGANRKKRVSSIFTCRMGSTMSLLSNRSLWPIPAMVMRR